jgi:multiple sugar transport system permease protein
VNQRTKYWRHLVLIPLAMMFGLPLLVLISSSLKSNEQLKRDPYSLVPGEPQFSNYSDAVSAMPFWTYVTNSLFLGIGCVVGTTFSCSLIAFSLARIRWRGKNLLWVSVIATLLIPWHVTMIPRFLIISKLGLYDSLWAIIVPTFLGDAFYIFLLRQFFLTIPDDLFEAAQIDGMNYWQMFCRIAVPLSIPALATVGLFKFIEVWNDFGSPLLYLNDPEKFPLAYGLERFVSSYSDQTHLLLAAAVLFTLPIVILFFLAQRTFIQGISTTGIKG